MVSANACSKPGSSIVAKTPEINNIKGKAKDEAGILMVVLRNGENCKQDKSDDNIFRIEIISGVSFDIDSVGCAR